MDKKRIEEASKKEFESREISFETAPESDIIVSLHMVTEQKQETTATTSGGGYGGYYGYGPDYRWGGIATTTYSSYEYTVGTLLILVYDAKSKQLVCQSAAQGTIDENVQNREADINNAVKALIAKYTVAPKTN